MASLVTAEAEPKGGSEVANEASTASLEAEFHQLSTASTDFEMANKTSTVSLETEPKRTPTASTDSEMANEASCTAEALVPKYRVEFLLF